MPLKCSVFNTSHIFLLRKAGLLTTQWPPWGQAIFFCVPRLCITVAFGANDFTKDFHWRFCRRFLSFQTQVENFEKCVEIICLVIRSHLPHLAVIMQTSDAFLLHATPRSFSSPSGKIDILTTEIHKDQSSQRLFIYMKGRLCSWKKVFFPRN